MTGTEIAGLLGSQATVAAVATWIANVISRHLDREDQAQIDARLKQLEASLNTS